MSNRMQCQMVSLDRVYELCFRLSHAIHKSGFVPDLMVAVARGGFVPARLLCDFLQHRDLTSLSVVHYAAGAQKHDRTRLSHPLAADVRDRRVLVVDDVNDSGETLAVVEGHLRELGVAEMRFAVVHEKESSSFRADYRAELASSGRWILYQWALVEDVSGFLERMEPKPRTYEEAARRLMEEFALVLDRDAWEKVSLAAAHFHGGVG